MTIVKYVHFLILLVLCFILSCCGPVQAGTAPDSAEENLLQKAVRIHDKILTIDTHVDTPYMLTRPGFDISVTHDARKGEGRVDFPRMKAGGLDAIFFAVFVGQGQRDPDNNQKAKERALGLFKAIKDTLQQHSQWAELALKADDAYRIEKLGKRAIYIGMENGYPIGNDLALLKKYYGLGTRYITLCHSRNNDICDSSTDRNGPEHHGLSPFGELVVKEMNRLGIMIDISHTSDETFYDVIRLSKAPIIASHSSARAICDSPRNLDDSMLKKLAENGGVIQVCILSGYVKKMEQDPKREKAMNALWQKYKNYRSLSAKEREEFRSQRKILNEKYPLKLATVADAVDHIDHIVKIAGIDHVGIGTDFDGGGGIDGCYDVSEMGNITIELVKRGYSEEQIRKIWGGNLIRVFREVEKIAGIDKIE